MKYTTKDLHYKVTYGYGSEDFIEVDTVEDLEKAIYAFSTGKSVRIGDTFVKGTDIRLIKEDYNKTMGYSRGYKLQNEDWNEISKYGVDKLYKGFLSDISDKVARLSKQGMEKYIGIDRRYIPEFKNLIELQ